MKGRRSFALGIVVGALATGLVGGLAWAAIPGPGGVIQACYDKTGSLKVVSELPCPKGSTALSWNQQGIQGEPGAAGPKGDAGAPGPKGDPGTLASFEQLGGTPCFTAGGVSGARGSIYVSYDATGQATLTCLGAPILTINELATSTSGTVNDAFIEVANTGTAASDLSEWRLVYRTANDNSTDFTLATIPAGTVLAPGGILLFAGSAYGGAHPADFGLSRILLASGAAVALRQPLGAGTTPVDSVGWGLATNAFVEGAVAPAPPAGSSIVRLPDGDDTNNNAADFSVTSTPTPGAPNQ